MILEGWAEYIPPPGSVYRIHYVPDSHNAAPDLNVMNRALDARPSVAVVSLDIEDEAARTVVADAQVFVGDSALVTVFGTFLSDGDNFWRVDYVERIDSGVPGKFGVTVERVKDALLDPIEDVTAAVQETARQTVATVKKVGIPTTTLLAIAVVAFFIARKL